MSSLDERGHLSFPRVWGHHELHEAILDDRIALERPIIVSVSIVDLLRVGLQLTRTVRPPGFLFHDDGKRLLKRRGVCGSQHEQIETHAWTMPDCEWLGPGVALDRS